MNQKTDNANTRPWAPSAWPESLPRTLFVAELLTTGLRHMAQDEFSGDVTPERLADLGEPVLVRTDPRAEEVEAFVRLRGGDPGKLPPPVPGYRSSLPDSARAMLEHLGQARAVGSAETVRARIARFVERTRADEIIVSGATYDPAARRRSLELTIAALR